MPILYRCPGELRHATRGFLYDVREFADVEAARAQGWAETLEEAAGLVPAAAPVSTREALEAEAKALGVGFNSRTTDETLAERIAAAKA